MNESRRTFVKQGAAALASLTAATGGAACAAPAAARPPLDSATLRTIAGIVLPTELGDAGVAAVVAEFEAWLEGFEPVAELEHGYGTERIRYGPPDPGPRWQAQLEALDIESRKRFGKAFVELPVDERRAMIVRELEAEPDDDMPSPLAAQHVSTALLAYYVNTPAAVDLCYRAQIGQYACRGLQDASERPAPLQAGS